MVLFLIWLVLVVAVVVLLLVATVVLLLLSRYVVSAVGLYWLNSLFVQFFRLALTLLCTWYRMINV